MKYDYKVLDLSGAPADEIQTELNKLAHEGWRLVHVAGTLHYCEREPSPADIKPPKVPYIPAVYREHESR